jgi:DNA-binding Lrp family transcriptional regulator
VIERLAELLGAKSSTVGMCREPGVSNACSVVELGGLRFVLGWTRSGEAARVSTAAEEVRKCASTVNGHTIPLVAVPFMGSLGRRRCEETGVAWLDLSGNARIFAQGIRVLILGKPNLFKRRGRPASAFAPKSSRITRWLLMHPGQRMSQREIARATGMNEGFTSRIVAKLEEDNLIIREQGGAIRPRDPDLLLDAWREVYTFSKHEIVRGHMAARSGDGLLRQFVESLRENEYQHAATGLGAAWLLTKFAGYRLVTIYVRNRPLDGFLEHVGFREEARGANVWLVIPNDEGVFHGAADHEGVSCVHPVQAYLDLLDHPERAKEAADHLRSELLDWSTDG